MPYEFDEFLKKAYYQLKDYDNTSISVLDSIKDYLESEDVEMEVVEVKT